MDKSFALLAGLFVSVAYAAAPAFELADYAWQAPVEESAAALQTIDLTRDLLAGLSHSEAADLALFDTRGQQLPSLLREQPTQIRDVWVDLSYQRFAQPDFAGYGGKLTLEQQQYQESPRQITRLSVEDQLRLTRDRPHYIIELSDQQRDAGIREIQLDWEHEPAGDFLKLDIQVANDIDHWKTIQRGKNLFRNDRGDADWTSLGNIETGYRYIRLVPDDSVTRFELKSARGRYRVEEPPGLLRLPGGELMQDPAQPGFYRFNQPLRVDASALRFALPSGYFLTGDLYSSDEGFDQKRMLRREVAQHSLDGDDDADRIDLRFGYATRYWFEPSQPLPPALQLEFLYPPYQLVFINNGHGPFTLAWGNHQVERHVDRLSPVIASQPDLELAHAQRVGLGETLEAGGIDRQIPPQAKPWLSWMLWLLLGAGVLITARMAWRLYLDMQR